MIRDMYPDKNHYFKQMQIEKFCFKSNWEDHLDVSQLFFQTQLKHFKILNFLLRHFERGNQHSGRV